MLTGFVSVSHYSTTSQLSTIFLWDTYWLYDGESDYV